MKKTSVKHFSTMMPCPGGCPACYEKLKRDLQDQAQRGETHVMMEWTIGGPYGSMIIGFVDGHFWLGLIRGSSAQGVPEAVIRLGREHMAALDRLTRCDGPKALIEAWMESARGTLETKAQDEEKTEGGS